MASSLGSRKPAPKLLRCELAEVCQLALLSLAALGHVLLRTCRHVHSTRVCPRPPCEKCTVSERTARRTAPEVASGCDVAARGGDNAGGAARQGARREGGRVATWPCTYRTQVQGAREGDARHDGKGMRSGGAWAGVGGCGLVRRVRHDVIVRDIDARAVLSRS